MSIETKSELLARALVIKNETVKKANTALRIGTILENMIDTTVQVEYPVLVAPSHTLVEDEASNTQEVGVLVSFDLTSTFDRGSIDPAYPPTVSGYRSGLPNAFTYVGAQVVGSYPSTLLVDVQSVVNYALLEGNNVWSSVVEYDEGPQPYDSDGQVYGSPLAAGSTASQSVTLVGRFLRFFGASASTPANSAQVRALASSELQTANANTFTLNTGTAQTKFVIALPPSRTISQVIDLDALNANITSEYVLLGTVSVQDGGGSGTVRTYNLYEMNIGAVYSASHRHQITTA